MKQTIALDFDGVLHSYEAGWTGYVPTGAPVPGAREFVEWCLWLKLEVIVTSCRAYTQIGREGMREWLSRHDFPANIPVTCEKPHAAWYVDDRGIRFEGDWEAVKELMGKPVWFRQQDEPQFGECE